MDRTVIDSDIGARPAGLASWLDSAADHLKHGWPEGSDPATDGRYLAAPALREVVRQVTRRPKTVALGVFAAGLALGVLGALLLSTSRSSR
jgi:hypothetical protein